MRNTQGNYIFCSPPDLLALHLGMPLHNVLLIIFFLTGKTAVNMLRNYNNSTTLRRSVMLTENNSILGSSALFHGCLTMRKYVPGKEHRRSVFLTI